MSPQKGIPVRSATMRLGVSFINKTGESMLPFFSLKTRVHPSIQVDRLQQRALYAYKSKLCFLTE